MYFLTTCTLFETCLFDSYVHLQIGLSAVLVFEFFEFFILDINPLLNKIAGNDFYPLYMLSLYSVEFFYCCAEVSGDQT
jgi:hypothetical protein